MDRKSPWFSEEDPPVAPAEPVEATEPAEPDDAPETTELHIHLSDPRVLDLIAASFLVNGESDDEASAVMAFSTGLTAVLTAALIRKTELHNIAGAITDIVPMILDNAGTVRAAALNLMVPHHTNFSRAALRDSVNGIKGTALLPVSAVDTEALTEALALYKPDDPAKVQARSNLMRDLTQAIKDVLDA